MSTYNDAVSECSCHRTNDSTQPIRFVFKMSEIGAAIAAAGESGLDGISILVGQNTAGKKTTYMVGNKKTGSNDVYGNPEYTDVNITTIAKGRPCPDWCDPHANALNS